jgi:hypothetical protein
MKKIEHNKTQIMVRQRCDCGKLHEIPEIEVGTCQYWKCGTCLDRQSDQFSKRLTTYDGRR